MTVGVSFFWSWYLIVNQERERERERETPKEQTFCPSAKFEHWLRRRRMRHFQRRPKNFVLTCKCSKWTHAKSLLPALELLRGLKGSSATKQVLERPTSYASVVNKARASSAKSPVKIAALSRFTPMNHLCAYVLASSREITSDIT